MDLLENFKAMESKQKVTLVVTIVLFIFVIYYGYITFFPSDSYSPEPVATVVAPPPAPAATSSNEFNGSPMNGNAQTDVEDDQASSPQSGQQMAQFSSDNDPVAPKPAQKTEPDWGVEKVPEQPVRPDQMQVLRESEEVQKQYLDLVNKYQIAQLQEKVALSEVGLANAKLQAAQIQSETNKVTGALHSANIQPAELAAAEQAKVQSAFLNVSVVFVAKQRGVWTAMLNASGNYYEVKVGTRLPDGSVVSRIDNRGIILTKDGVRRPVAIPKTLN